MYTLTINCRNFAWVARAISDTQFGLHTVLSLNDTAALCNGVQTTPISDGVL